ncbi:MAG: hypothetical protein ACFE9L_21765 [Candidatus Hodarchaeota archaeon]
MKRTKFTRLFLITLALLSFINIIEVYARVQEDSVLFISEDIIDTTLIARIKNNMNSSGDVTDIKTSENLNDLFLENKYLERYSTIIMAVNQVTTPFNETLIAQLEDFIQKGGTYVIISTQIWRYPQSFHNLLKLSINSTGLKEWPPGNSSTTIDLLITNDSLTQNPYIFLKGSIVQIQGKFGIASPIDDIFSIALSQNASEGGTTVNAFQRESGFIIAAPISPSGTNTSIITFSELLTSILISKPSKDSDSLVDNPLRHLIKISEDLQFIIVSSTIILLFSLFSYSIYNYRRNNINFESAFPKDHDWLSTFLLGPLIFIGHVIYPPLLRRINEEAVIENETRQKIIESLKDRDFLHFRELKRELGIGTSSLKWHLRVLEDFKVIHHQKVGQYEIFFLKANAPNYEFLEIYFAIISGIGFRVANSFLQMNSWNLDTLTDYLGYSKEAIRYHLKNLEKIHLLKPIGKNKYYINGKKVEYLKKAINRRKKTN